MKIAFFSESYKPYLSGVTNSIETLSNALTSLGHEVMIFAPDYPSATRSDNVHRYPSIRAPYPGYRLAIPRPFETMEILKRHKIDIIHSHSPYQLGLMSMWCANRLDLPFVFTMHTIFDQYVHYIPLIPTDLTEKLMVGYIKGFADRCDTVIVPTQKAKDHLLLSGTRARIEIIPTGIDLKLFEGLEPERIRKKYKIPATTKVLMYSGRLAQEKNVSFLLRAFKLISGRVKDVLLLIVAGGPLELDLKKLAADLGIFDKVTFTGQIPYPEVLNYYAASDLFVFSSLTETQGLVLAESMAAGTPVVAVNAQGVSDMVRNGENGYLVDNNEAIFADKVIELLNNDALRKSLVDRAKNDVRMFSSGTFAGKVTDIYASLLK